MTTQTQVTGPVDDAEFPIDPIQLFDGELLDEYAACKEREGTSVYANDLRTEALNRMAYRLSPRADAALIERIAELLCGKYNAYHLTWDEADDEEKQEFRSDAAELLALLPRAPMPDVVTKPVDVRVIVETLNRELGYSHTVHELELVAVWIVTALAEAALEATNDR